MVTMVTMVAFDNLDPELEALDLQNQELGKKGAQRPGLQHSSQGSMELHGGHVDPMQVAAPAMSRVNFVEMNDQRVEVKRLELEPMLKLKVLKLNSGTGSLFTDSLVCP